MMKISHVVQHLGAIGGEEYSVVAKTRALSVSRKGPADTSIVAANKEALDLLAEIIAEDIFAKRKNDG